MQHRAYISIGSNIEPDQHVRVAVQALRERYGALTVSPVYESEAVGFAGDRFYNLVVGIETGESVGEVNQALHAIEDRYGRDRSGPRFSSRSIDLDLLLYDQLIGEHDGVMLPRDEIPRHAHVLCPLADLLPNELHPVLQQSYQRLWQAFAVPAGFRRIELELSS